MASVRRSSGTSPSAGSEEGGFGGLDIVGVDRTLDTTSREVRREFGQGGHFKSLSVPSSVSASGSLTVSGVMHYDDPIVGSVAPFEYRVRVSGPSLTQDYTQDFTLSHCQTRTFSFDIPARGSPGDTMVLTVDIIAIGAATNPVEDSRGPFRVDVLSKQSAALGRAVDYAPYAGIGAVGGLALSEIAGGDRTAYMLGGAGVGAAAKATGFQVGLNTFDIDTTELVLVGAGLAGIGVFLNQSGASEVLQPAGEAAGSAIESGRRRLESRR